MRARRLAGRAAGAAAGGALAALVGFLLLDLAHPFPHAALHPPPGRIVRDASGGVLRVFLASDDRYRFPVALEEVSPVLRRVLLASEDRWFRLHPGVNPAAIVRAGVANLRAGRVVSGASTITMQVARLVQPRPRTWGAKLIEMFRALQLEWHYDKDEILAAYLNLAPFGGNLEGVAAASYFYFGKAPGRLSLGEAALLTALPRSPAAYDPVRNPQAAARAREGVLRQLQARGVVTAQEAADALRQPVPARLRPVPYRAPHLARAVHERLPAIVADARTTIDGQLQDAAEALVASRVAGLRGQGIDNAAVVLIENRTRAVRARVGSAAFFDRDHQGQVDGTAALRSPGSTLKPLLYALAIDRGAIVMDSYLLDVPTDFAGYVAENYDGEYRGRVTAGEALRLSLNAPAVRLLADVGLERFHELLLSGGLRTLDRPPLHYGLPLVLGAGEVRLLDLTNLYASLAEGGVHRPAVMLEGELAEPARRLVSAEAAWLVTRQLTEVGRPDLPESWRLARRAPAVAWKTGTSYGHRDAWAVGYSGRYAIGVWVGNPSGRPQKGISGSAHAGPLLFDLFGMLPEDGAPPPTERPRGLGLSQVRVCAVSHELPGPFCPATVQVEVADPATRLGSCAVHRRVFLDAETGARLVGRCLAARPHREAVLEVLPAELVAWERAHGRAGGVLPALSPACDEIPAGPPLRILSPDAATPYLWRHEAPAEHQGIPLTARAGAEVRRLYWYQDGELVAAGTADARLFVTPLPGEHELVVVDDAGRADSVRYRVEGR